VAILLVAALGGCSPSPDRSFQQGVACYQQGKYAQAAEHLERALGKAPPTAQALTLLGVCQLKLGKTTAASRSFNEALKLDPHYTPARYNLALLYLEHGQLESAANLLRQVVQQPGAPADASNYLAIACNNLGVIAARQRDFPRAEKYLREALTANPRCAEAAQNVAAVKTRAAPPAPPARATATTATAATVAATNAAPKPPATVAAPPPAPPATQTVPVAASAPTRLSSPPGAKRRAALAPRSLSLGDRKQALVYFNEAFGLQQQGRLTGVVELYEKAIAADPSFAAAYYNLANACRDLRQVDRAFENYELALMADPKFTDARRNYAILLQQQGYIADALDQYEILLQENPDDATLHVVVAGLYAADRATLAKARRHYEAYLRLVPNAPHAAEIRRWLDENR